MAKKEHVLKKKLGIANQTPHKLIIKVVALAKVLSGGFCIQVDSLPYIMTIYYMRINKLFAKMNFELLYDFFYFVFRDLRFVD